MFNSRNSLHRPVIVFALMMISLLANAPSNKPLRVHAQFNEIELSAPNGETFVVASNTTLDVPLRAINMIGIELSSVKLTRVDGTCDVINQCPEVVLTSTLPSFLDAFGTPAAALVTFQIPPVAAGSSVTRRFTFTASGRYREFDGTGIPPLTQVLPGVWVPVFSNPLVIVVTGVGPALPTNTPLPPPTSTSTPDGATPPPPTPTRTGTPSPAATHTPIATPPIFVRRLWLPALMRDSGLEIEPNNHAGQSMAIPAQRVLSGRFNDQYDVYRFVTTAPGPVIIDLLGLPSNMAGRVQLQLYYNDLLSASRRDQAVNLPYRIAHTGPAGTYYIVVYTDPAFINVNVGYQLLASYTP